MPFDIKKKLSNGRSYAKVDVIAIIIVFLAYFIFFNHLGEYPLRMWDEARNAVNAQEMLKTKNLLVPFYRGTPDIWNTKPPFFIWMASISFILFGVNEFALRLPSAIAATLIALGMYFFSKNFLKNRWIGVLAVLILFSSMGFSDIHIGRSGDYDAMLTMWVFLASVFFFIYIKNREKKYLNNSILFLTLAVLTKGIAGLLVLPGVLIYLLFTKNLKRAVGNVYFWKLIAVFCFLVLGYYWGREVINPGYLNAVWKEEFFTRFGSVGQFGRESFWYYWKYLTEFRFQKWAYFVPLSITSVLLTKDRRLRAFILYSYLITIVYFLIISVSKTKNIWYDAQLYPFASLLVSILIIQLIKRIPFLLKSFSIIALCYYLQLFIRTNLAYIDRPDLEESNSCIKYGYLARDTSVNLNGYYAIHKDEDYCMPLQFYLGKAGLRSKRIDNVKTSDLLFSCDMPSIAKVEQNFQTIQKFNSRFGCIGIEVVGVKN